MGSNWDERIIQLACKAFDALKVNSLKPLRRERVRNFITKVLQVDRFLTRFSKLNWLHYPF